MEQKTDQEIKTTETTATETPQRTHVKRSQKNISYENMSLPRALELLEGARLTIIENDKDVATNVRIREKDTPKQLLKLLEESRKKINNTADLGNISPKTLREYSTLNFRNNIQELHRKMGVNPSKEEEKERQHVYNEAVVVIIIIIAVAVALAVGPDGCGKIQKKLHHQKQTPHLVEPNTEHRMSNLWE